MAAQPSHSEVHALLLANDGNPSALFRAFPHFDANATPPDRSMPYLHEACFKNRFVAVRGLLACGASLLQRIQVNGYFPPQKVSGYFPLIRACGGWEESRVELVAWLLTAHTDARATVNWSNNLGNTCLHHIAQYANVALARVLLAHDADPTLEFNGCTPAQHARYWANTEVAEVLEAAERAHAVLAIGEWRPCLHHRFPRSFRVAMRTLVLLAKARTQNPANRRELDSHYPQACLDLLPEELLQYLFVFVTAAPVPDAWTQSCFVTASARHRDQ